MSDLTNLRDDDNADIIINPNLQRKVIDPSKEFGIRSSKQAFMESDASKLEEQKTYEEANNAIDRLIERKEMAREIVESVDGDITPEELLEAVDPNYRTFENMLDGIESLPKPKREFEEEDFIKAEERKKQEVQQATITSQIEPTQNNIPTNDELTTFLEESDDDIVVDRVPSEIKPDDIPTIDPVETEVEETKSTLKDDNLDDLDLTQELNIPDEIEYVDTDDDLELSLLEDDDKDDDELSSDIIRDQRLESIKKSIREKIRPISTAFDISTYTVAGSASVNSSIEAAMSHSMKSADWILSNTKVAITMKEFSGETLSRLRNLSEARATLNSVKESFRIFYDHIISEKPDDFDTWCKTVSMFDVPDLYAAAYRASFESLNYLPYECENPKCTCSFISDNIPFMNLVKFTDKDAEETFNSIYNDPSARSFAKSQVTSEIIPISDYFAIKCQSPSIYRSSIEPMLLSADFRKKYNSIIPISMCVVEIYRLDHVHKGLIPINVRKFKDNREKSLRAEIITLNKIIKTLNADQMTVLSSYINNLSDEKDLYKLTTPSMQCPQCDTLIEEVDYPASTLLFIRHQIAALANG